MEKQVKTESTLPLKRKRKSKAKIKASEPKVVKIDTASTPVKNTESKKSPEEAKIVPNVETTLSEDAIRKYPILNNQELINRFMKVALSNNQKGRIRQAIQLQYQNTSAELVPDIIHAKIQGILRSTENLTDAELRRIRIMYNMLKTSLLKGKVEIKPVKKKNKEEGKEKEKVGGGIEKEGKEVQKQKGPKRYVVFLGNLPLDIDKEKIMNHFVEMNEQIVDVRFPKIREGKKSAIAYLELANEPSYELALSKHHSMLGSRRINVLYSTQKTSKISKAQAKSTSAKLIALQKSGKLIGSVPLAKKRSQRRLKMKKAKAKEAQK